MICKGKVNERTIEGRQCGTYNIGLYRLDGGYVDDLELFLPF